MALVASSTKSQRACIVRTSLHVRPRRNLLGRNAFSPKGGGTLHSHISDALGQHQWYSISLSLSTAPRCLATCLQGSPTSVSSHYLPISDFGVSTRCVWRISVDRSSRVSRSAVLNVESYHSVEWTPAFRTAASFISRSNLE